MRRLHRLPTVSAKLFAIVAIISAVTTIGVATIAGVVLFTERSAQRAEIVESQARIVAMNSSAALAFDDREMAAEALRALQAVEGVRWATLRDKDGRIVASYRAADAPLDAGSATGPAGGSDGYPIVLPVSDAAGVHGELQVEYRNTGTGGLVLRIALYVLGLFAIAMAMAWWLAHWLHPVLTAPVLELERATRQVRATGDYGIRARRISDDELARLTDDFNAMLEEIGTSQRALQQAQRSAEEASRLKDEFVATVSHELRTPLSPIVAWLQLLRLPGSESKLPKALDVMERNARALTLIINDLLDMSRIVSGTMRLELRPQELDPCLRAALDTVGPAAQGRQIELVLQLATPEPVVRADPARLQQILWNLLSNAVKFTEPGGRVELATRLSSGHVEIAVRDTGMGIDQAFLPFVFDRFRQQDGSITRARGGLGLGLAIVRQLVELHGGTVAAESDGPGTGATFRIRLPRLADDTVASKPCAAEPPGPPRLDGLSVLVIEDEPDMRHLVEHILTEAGATVTGAGGSDEALAAFASGSPDVVVSDIGLPGIDGYALLGQLRALSSATLPAVALTAYARPDERRRALDAGYQAHLSKPVDADELVRTVDRVRIRAGEDRPAPSGGS